MNTRIIPTVVVASFLLMALTFLDADAAQRGKGRGNAPGKAKNGPSFCRSGAGHPVYGRQWCLEQGFGLGEAAWRHARVSKVVFGRVPEGRVENPHLGAREIAEILTDVVLDEIFGESHHDLVRSDLSGTWRGGSDDGILVLEVLIGGEPVAELTDIDLDGTVDVTLIAGR